MVVILGKIMEKICKKYGIRPVSNIGSIEDKVVIVRVDFNVPLDLNGRITDSFRVKNSIDTIYFLLERGAKVVLMSHLGDPKSVDEAMSFGSIIDQLEEALGCKIQLSAGKALDEIGKEFSQFTVERGVRQVFLLDNIRCFPGEKSNDHAFVNEVIRQLKVDYYVNDAFSVCHRKHGSVVGIPSLVEESFAGLSLVTELDKLEGVIGDSFNSDKIVTAIIGGKKVETKLLLLKSLAKKVKNLVIVGGMANTFLKARGVDIGKSFYEPEMLDAALKIDNVILPVDFVDQDGNITCELTGDRAAYDIGPESLKLIDSIISKSDVVIWNGPAGVYEDERFVAGSNGIASSIAKHKVKSLVGGGDTVSVVNKLGVKVDHISTGGGAFISWLEDENLPGINSLKRS